jgi:hypothetical protein
MKHFVEDNYMTTITDEFMRQMISNTKNYCIVMRTSLSQSRLTSYCQLPPLHPQQSCINHLIVNHNRP